MKSRDWVLFLHGRYQTRDLSFYRMLCQGKRLMAVDGGYSFFRKTGIKPDLLIGDFDSLKKIPRELPSHAIIRHPRAKDATDAELGLRYCLERGARSIDIVQPSTGEIDQFIGNLMILLIPATEKRSAPTKIRIISAGYEVHLLRDKSLSFKDAVGDVLSVIPISSRITYSCSGTEFDVAGRTVRLGWSLATRNTIQARVARFRVRGIALLVRLYRRKGRKRVT
jgi:thiamine pyrophosphokinase